MGSIVEEVVTENGYKLHIVPTTKYKTVNFVVKFRSPISRDTITKRALLPFVLRQGTLQYPSERELQLKLDNLYGAVLSIDGAKKGNNHIISFRLEVANDKYIKHEGSLIDEALSFLKEVIYQPKTVQQHSFDPKIITREKETLQQKIKSIVDNKMAYANMRLIDEMCAEERYGIRVNGYEEDLQSITPENAYEYYQSLLQEDQLDIYVLGDFDEGEMKEKIISTFKRESYHKASNEVLEEQVDRRNDVQEVIEKQHIQQAKLHLGYRTHTTFKDPDYFALQVFNGLFGSFPSSKLFINVREKNSLAYYAASRIESHKGLLLVFSGIAAQDYEKAREIIEKQMDAMKQGDFTDSELTETKELIINELLETLDHPQGIVELLYQQVIGNKQITPDELFAGIRQVTKEEVINIANKITEDTVYLLTSEEDQANE